MAFHVTVLPLALPPGVEAPALKVRFAPPVAVTVPFVAPEGEPCSTMAKLTSVLRSTLAVLPPPTTRISMDAADTVRAGQAITNARPAARRPVPTLRNT